MTKFEVLSKIGEGGMGEVYRGRIFNDSGFEKFVAAKKVFGISSSSQSSAILREAEILSKLNHPNICSVIDIREFEGHQYILMELIEGINLMEVLELSIQRGYRFSEEFIWIIAKQVLRALSHAHTVNNSETPIIHRDLTPHNIMINNQGVVKVLDFGLAKVQNFDLSLSQKTTYGKIRYCAPEIFQNEAHGIATDLYSMGIILFELSLGIKLFDGLSEAQIINSIQNDEMEFSTIEAKGYSKPLAQFIQKLTTKITKNRYQNTSLALADLEAIVNSQKAISDEYLKEEISKLKSSFIEHTKTIVNPVSSNRNIRKSKIAVFSSIGLFVLFIAAIAGYSLTQRNSKIVIKVVSENKLIELKSIQSNPDRQVVGGELGYSMSAQACLYSAKMLLSFPSLITTDDLEKQLRHLNVKDDPNTFLTSIRTRFLNQRVVFEYLQKNCGHNDTFRMASDLYKDFEKNVQMSNGKSFSSFIELKQYFESKNLFTEKKWGDIIKAGLEFEPNESRLYLEDQLKSLKLYDTKKIAGVSIFSLDDVKFPRNLSECRRISDMYWVQHSLSSEPQSDLIIDDLSIIVMPFPSNAEIQSYGAHSIEFSDNSTQENSKFKKCGVCVYHRRKGEVIESSLRFL